MRGLRCWFCFDDPDLIHLSREIVRQLGQKNFEDKVTNKERFEFPNHYFLTVQEFGRDVLKREAPFN